MSIKIFVIGRPGSGKSTAARHIHQSLQRRGWTTRHVNDYDILKEMFLADHEHKHFRPTPNNGFDALNPVVFDIALREVERRVSSCVHNTDLITIEFARDDYRHALHQFSYGFLYDAHFLFLDADINTCLRRVHERVNRPTGHDDHPSFSDEIFLQYYAQDNRSFFHYQLREEFLLQGIIKVINNTGPLDNYLVEIDHCLNIIRQQRRQPILNLPISVSHS